MSSWFGSVDFQSVVLKIDRRYTLCVSRGRHLQEYKKLILSDILYENVTLVVCTCVFTWS